MTNIVFSLLLDAVVAGLLGITIIYCWKLNKRIRILQDSKSELAQLIEKFDESTQQATRSINEIHTVSKKINESIKARVEKANYIADDLAFMIEKGNKLASRMEHDISDTRKKVSGPAKPESRAEARPGRVTATRRRPEGRDELIAEGNSPGAAEEEDTRRTRARPSAETKDKRAGALEGMLEKISAGKTEKKEGAATGRKVRAGVRLRSKTEQELYDALKTEH